MHPRTAPLAHQRAFTLLELIVTLLVLGVLAALAVVGYTQYTAHAQVARVKTNLAQYATGTLAHATLTGATQLSRTDVTTALSTSNLVVTDTVTAAGSPVRLLAASVAPTGPDQVSLAFDTGDSTPISDTSGSRLWLSSATPDGHVYVQLVTLGGVDCATTQNPGVTLTQARRCTPLPKYTSTVTVSTVSGWPVDVTPTGTATAPASTPDNGTVTTTSDGHLRYVSADTFVGTDSFTYPTAAGLNQVIVTVNPLTSCTTTTGIDPAWVPAGTGTSPTCPVDSVGETPTLAGSGLVATSSGDMSLTALASYPHSDTSYPHVIYATTASGGLAYVQDTGDQGTTTPAGLAGCGGASPTCRWGWLYGPGTFSSPTAAITGQGPNHGTIPARFTIDSMFVADSRGIYVSRVNAFVHGTAPTQLLSAAAYNGKVTALAGFTCFTGPTPVAGNCLWFVTDAGVLGQLNVDTGTLTTSTLTIANNVTYGAFGAPRGLTTTSLSGQPRLQVTSATGSLAYVRPDGTVDQVDWQSTGTSVTAATVADGKLMWATDNGGLWAGQVPTSSPWSRTAAMTAKTTNAPAISVHTHGVPGFVYYGSATPSPCLYRMATATGTSTQLWCGGVPAMSGPVYAWPASYGSGDVWDVRGMPARYTTGDFTLTVIRGYNGAGSLGNVVVRPVCYRKGYGLGSEVAGSSTWRITPQSPNPYGNTLTGVDTYRTGTARVDTVLVNGCDNTTGGLAYVTFQNQMQAWLDSITLTSIRLGERPGSTQKAEIWPY